MALERSFDERHGVDTAEPQEVARADVVGDHWVGGVSYQAVAQRFDLGTALEPLGLDLSRFTFVDLGAGKGRALLLAAELPFRRIVGVEYSRTLAAIASDNVARVADARIEVVHADAIDFPFPDEPLVLFLFNPFECDLMEQLVANVGRSFEASARRIVVVYYTPRCAEAWARSGCVRSVGNREGAAIFDTGPVEATESEPLEPPRSGHNLGR